MKKFKLSFLLLLTGILLLSACRKTEDGCATFDPHADLLATPPGFPEVQFPAGNEFTQARWELGKKLFYDPILSRTNTHSCASCHKTNLAFADNLPTTPGIENRPGKRNAPTLANVAYHPYILREGSNATLEMQVLVPIQESNEFDHNIVDISYQLRADTQYIRMSDEAYGRLPDPFVITRAIGTFERTLISGNSPYDKYAFQGCSDALTPSQKRGMDLFFDQKVDCNQCHGGFNFTEYAFENNGLYADSPDPGRMHFTNDSADLAKFKVPSLRNIAHTAPYMYDGSLQSLEEVIEHYDKGGNEHPNQNHLIRPLHLTELEKADLLQFLLALSDESFLSNPAFQK